MIRLRPARAADAPGLAAILNRIVGIGGTTAIEERLSPESFAHWFLSGPDALLCVVAEDDSGTLGFQSLSGFAPLPPGWADIGTFTRREPRVPGVGTALFAPTCEGARALGLTTINATIRADNTGGLAFYRKLGFRPYGLSPAVPLADGTPVDRLHHRFDL